MVRGHGGTGRGRVTLPVLVLALTLLLAACTPTPERRDEAPREELVAPATPAPGPADITEPPDAPGFVESVRPDGVRVLGSDLDAVFDELPAGRYAVPLTRSVGYEIDLPETLRVFAGAFFNLEVSGSTATVFVDGPLRGLRLPRHPCTDHRVRAVPSTGPGLLDALRRQPGLEVGTPGRSTLDGRRAVTLTVALPAPVAPSGCEDGRVVLYGGRDPADAWVAGAGYEGRLWVVRIGGTPTSCATTITAVPLRLSSRPWTGWSPRSPSTAPAERAAGRRWPTILPMPQQTVRPRR